MKRKFLKFLIIFHIILITSPGFTQESPNPSTISISVFPNPFSDQVKITINAEKGADLSVVVYNILGRKVKGWRPEGWRPFFDDSGNECPAGLYLFAAEGDNFSSFEKVVKSER
ncbi:MAG: T9SS type A sorting domain-containing protein [Bacteroidales bacterium]|nr:T9SS type A sorting domain-containing protein [Bacteroidales bacterium]